MVLHERRVLYLDAPESGEYGWKYIDQYMADHQCKNRGEAVGVTMPHPHGQIYAYSYVPKKLEVELASSKEYYEEKSHCLFCDILKNEKEAKSRIIFENEDFITEYPELNKLYDTLYSVDDLKDVLKLPVSQMRKMITQQLPVGAVDAIKGLAASMIMNGSLDSTAKIKALDEIFGTHLLLTLAQG